MNDNDNNFISRYQLTISAATNAKVTDNSILDNSALNDFEFSIELSGGEKSSYTFSKLPEIIGSGYPYTVQVRVVATSPREVRQLNCCANYFFGVGSILWSAVWIQILDTILSETSQSWAF